MFLKHLVSHCFYIYLIIMKFDWISVRIYILQIKFKIFEFKNFNFLYSFFVHCLCFLINVSFLCNLKISAFTHYNFFLYFYIFFLLRVVGRSVDDSSLLKLDSGYRKERLKNNFFFSCKAIAWQVLKSMRSSTNCSVMQSDRNRFCGDVVLDSVKRAFRDKDCIYKSKYMKSKYIGLLLL